MGSKVLSGLRMTVEAGSYADALHAIVAHSGWASWPKSVLSGLTATAFRFVVNRRLAAESPTAYNWAAEHFVAADMIGVASSSQAGFSFDATFPLYREYAVLLIKQSIDRGIGAVMWKDGFVVVAGYDDKAGVLHYCDGSGETYKTLPYAEFGRNASPYWYYQVLEGLVELDEREMIKESLLQALAKWKTHDPMLPETDYACGRRAYDALMEAFRSGAYDPQGAAETLGCYAAAKRQIALYFKFVRQNGWRPGGAEEEERAEIAEIAEHYERVSRLFQEMLDLQGERDPSRLILALEEAQMTEERATQRIRRLVREALGNRCGDIALR